MCFINIHDSMIAYYPTYDLRDETRHTVSSGHEFRDLDNNSGFAGFVNFHWIRRFQ